jgi:SIR2-like domain
MPFSFNTDLVDDIAQRRFVLFVGAGVSRWAKPAEGGAYKDWSGFLSHACAELPTKRLRGIARKLIEDKDYLLASEIIRRELADGWVRLLQNEFQRAAEVTRLHRALLALRPRIAITTNFDKLLDTAWSSTATRYPTVVTTIDARAFRLFRDDDDYLIKLHGSIDQADEITFDRSSYRRDAFENRYYTDLLSTLLLTHTFVFVGFSMADPAVSGIVESAAFRFPETRPHYIFQSGSAVRELDELSKTQRKLFVLRYRENNDHVELAEQIEALAARAESRRRELSAEMMAREA